ncbi:hypothetical protein ACIGCK_14480 [Microbacterium sp. NPDC078428]|uniref:hypothetical protein n=1 Tax=Microbacterium sp. NPDC078428 TaxID=3364190 RepID=UPI0037C85BE7
MRLTIDHGGRPTDLDLGDTSEQTGVGFFDDGDLGSYGGNLYLRIDGVEYGQLFFYTIDGAPRIELGQFTPATEQWEPVNPLTVSVPDLVAADEAEQEGK